MFPQNKVGLCRLGTAGGTYFFTIVTHNRPPILIEDRARTVLGESIRQVQSIHPFQIDAWVLLPDHIHAIWTLPENDNDFSTRWGMIKAGFSKRIGALSSTKSATSESRKTTRESGFWQRRFWEHLIRDDEDYHRQMDYVHYNPMKHGLVSNVADWPYSTIHRCKATGIFPKDWGKNEVVPCGVFGE